MLWILLLLSVSAFGQFTSTARHIGPYPAAPAACSTASGDIYYNTTSKTPFYCSGPNVWTAMGAGGGGGTVTSVSGTANQISVSSPTTTPVIGFTTTPIMPNGTTATTQTAGSNDTKLATDAFVVATAAPLCSATITTGTTATLSTCFTVNQNATAATGVAYTLPTAASGLQFCIDNGWNGSAANTGVLTLSTSASGQFIVFTDGTLSATGGNVTSGGAARDGACVYGIDSTHWMLYPHSGTWTKH